MGHHPKISVIMSAYNEEKYLEKSIESVLNQTFTDFEFIIVNDASKDRSKHIIQNYMEIDKRIRLVDNNVRLGLTASLNKALKEAKGKYIARQDGQDFSLPHRFELQIEYLESHPKTALLGTNTYLMDERGRIFLETTLPRYIDMNRLRFGNSVVHGSMMLRKIVANNPVLYNELFRYVQDYELLLRIIRKCEVHNLTTPLYVKRYKRSINVRVEKERMLYVLLARKLAREELDEKIIESIRKKGFEFLDMWDRALFYVHFSLSYMLRNYMYQNKFGQATYRVIREIIKNKLQVSGNP